MTVKKSRSMNETEIKQMREKIDMGIRLARQRLIEKTKREGGELVVAQEGKIVYLQAKDL